MIYRVEEVRQSAIAEYHTIRAQELQDKQHADNQAQQIQQDHAKTALMLQEASNKIVLLETNEINRQSAVPQSSEVSTEAIQNAEKLSEAESTVYKHQVVLIDAQKLSRKKLQEAKLEKETLEKQMEILNDELRKATSKVTSPTKVRALPLGAKRPAAVTFDISTPRDHDLKNAGGDPKSDNEDNDVFANAEWVHPEEGEESEVEEKDDDEDANDPSNRWSEEDWDAWDAWNKSRKTGNDASSIVPEIVEALKKKDKDDKTKESDVLVTTLKFGNWPSHADSKGWRCNTKEKWAKGTKDTNGCLKRLQEVEIASTWQELLEDESCTKIDRLAFDALWEMLAPKLRSELTDLKVKLMNPTDPNVLPTFLHARQVLWFILREFKKPGALLGQQSLRDLLCVNSAIVKTWLSSKEHGTMFSKLGRKTHSR